MKLPLLTVLLRLEHDVVTARQRARQVAELLGFDAQDQTRIATAVSEIARNAVTYACGGRIEFAVEGASAPQLLVIEVTDKGPGIARLDEVMSGRYRSRTGMGLGILGAKRLLDGFAVASAPGGTRIAMHKVFPRGARFWTQADLAVLSAKLEARVRAPQSLLDELKQQNHELVLALEQLEERQSDLARLNAELSDTNRGVLALYAELDEKADHLRRADELKTKFLSNMSHEFRTPLNSILALTRLLLDRVDGDLTAEQDKQVAYIRRSASELLDLVNDLLDLAKVEAGKITVRPEEFAMESLFGALRGMLRPLLISPSVNLVFEDASTLPNLRTDEAKVSQILRNFLSNALKFTERGEIRVSAELVCAGDTTAQLPHPVEQDSILVRVADTGIGIAEADQEIIFEEFTQIEHRLQHRVTGTGLGLPLCRRLATVLGGAVWVHSKVGEGSSFFLLLPLVHSVKEALEIAVPESEDAGVPLLLVEDRPEDREVVRAHLRHSGFALIVADRLSTAQALIATAAPVAVILDIMLTGEDAWRFLPEIKRQEIPTVVVSAIDDRRKGFALGADAYGVKPVTREWLLSALYRAVLHPKLRHVLVVDDDDGTREVLKRYLAPVCEDVAEAPDGARALLLLQSRKPDLVLLDLTMPFKSGLDLLLEMRASQELRDVPVLIGTSKSLSAREDSLLAELDAPVLDKTQLSRENLMGAILRIVARRPSMLAAESIEVREGQTPQLPR